MENYTTNNNILKTEEFILPFDHDIADVKLVNNMFIILLRIPKGSKEVDNLFGISSNGNMVWRVQSVQEAFNIQHNTPYIAVDIINDAMIQVTNFYGMRYGVNPKNGYLINRECIRW